MPVARKEYAPIVATNCPTTEPSADSFAGMLAGKRRIVMPIHCHGTKLDNHDTIEYIFY